MNDLEFIVILNAFLFYFFFSQEKFSEVDFSSFLCH